jgi:hypothetical protein
VLPKIGFHLPLQGCDLLVQRGQDSGQGADRGGVGRGHDGGLPQVPGAQHGLDLPGFPGDVTAAGAPEGRADLRGRQPGR